MGHACLLEVGSELLRKHAADDSTNAINKFILRAGPPCESDCGQLGKRHWSLANDCEFALAKRRYAPTELQNRHQSTMMVVFWKWPWKHVRFPNGFASVAVAAIRSLPSKGQHKFRLGQEQW